MEGRITGRRRLILILAMIAITAVFAVYLVMPRGIEAMEVYSGGKPVGETISLIEGDTTKLTFRIEPDEFSDRQVKCRVSDPDVLSVSEGGTVKALKQGEAVITAEAAGFRKNIGVKVEEVDPGVKDIKGIDDDMYMHVGSSIVLEPELVMESDDLEEPKIEYKSGNEKVVRVLDDGGVIAEGPGETVITVKAGKVTKTIEVKIEE